MTLPNEQKTQQSPALGRSKVWQALHSKKYTHASVGISSSLAAPQRGHVSVEYRTGVDGAGVSASTIDQSTRNDGAIEHNPAHAGQVDVLVALLQAEHKPKEC